MRRYVRIIWLAEILFFAFSGIVFAQKDADNCKDHPMFTRMANFYIEECKIRDFDQVEFLNEKGEEEKVEGKFYWVSYEIKEGAKAPSELQILRNFENAIRKIGGVVVVEDGGEAFLKLEKDNKTYWIVVYPHCSGECYELTIVEKAEMVQEIVADAKSLMSDINATGHASVYGIYFDFDKAVIKPESKPIIKEIAKLLKDNTDLKLYVVGHTDNIGSFNHNMKLSKERASAVIKELVAKYKVAPERLKAYGVGALAPVATNKTDEGRSKNRRVELVEQ